MSPYAAALRLKLIDAAPDYPTSQPQLKEIARRLSLDPPDFTGAAEAWAGLRLPLTDAPSAAAQIRRWIAGDVACRVERWQPPGYTPPPKRNGRPVQVREWHAEAGSAPDGVVAAAHGVSLAAVRDYRRRNGVAAFKAPPPASKPTTPQG